LSEPNYITPVGLERITRELEWLQKVERPQVVREVTAAAALGDRSENAEYIYGKKRLREIDRRLHFLTTRVGHIVVVDPASLSGDVVRFGAVVLIADNEGQEREWRIFGEDEVSVEKGVLSWKSPLARALMGRQEGEAVRYEAPGGKREVEILEVRYEPAPPLEESPISPLSAR